MLTGEGEGEGEELEASLEAVRKIPLKLKRRGDLGGDSCDGGEVGNSVLGESGLPIHPAGAVNGLGSWGLSGPLRNPVLVGVAE